MKLGNSNFVFGLITASSIRWRNFGLKSEGPSSRRQKRREEGKMGRETPVSAD